MERALKLTAVAQAQRVAEEAREAHKAELKNRKRKMPEESESDTQNAHALDKYGRRLHLNRQSASAARVRREVYITALEGSLNAMETQNHTLEKTVEALRREKQELNRELEVLRLHMHYQQQQQQPQTVTKSEQVAALAAEEDRAPAVDAGSSSAAPENNSEACGFDGWVDLDKDEFAAMVAAYVDTNDLDPSLFLDRDLEDGPPAA
ncbi:hypothetical protein FVE85_0830 [Porphyridium purpureum]|uniref:BZIP domain-containing protein n=1 Tax=Porphyridium purpureum TaxID=35688 RepID=A0A5J4YZL7_PORPP|nr:hypothetical protein FVE85_0830 [Porphyridium purpureum]|eukprot:POR0399..scf208_2